MLNKLILACIILISTSVFGQQEGSVSMLKRRLINIEVTKTGPYFGIRRGKYTVLEIGAERQWKKIRIRKPITHAVHAGFNYNFKYNMLGYDMGYWHKPNRIGLTYGGNIFFRTNFDDTRVGIAPVIGFKIAIVHLQTGYQFMQKLPENFETNRFFVSLRIGIINNRDIDFNRRKKGKKKR